MRTIESLIKSRIETRYMLSPIVIQSSLYNDETKAEFDKIAKENVRIAVNFILEEYEIIEELTERYNINLSDFKKLLKDRKKEWNDTIFPY